MACAAFNAAIASALAGAASAQSLDRAVVATHDGFEAARRSDPQLHNPGLHLQETQGFVRVAFRLAFWE